MSDGLDNLKWQAVRPFKTKLSLNLQAAYNITPGSFTSKGLLTFGWFSTSVILTLLNNFMRFSCRKIHPQPVQQQPRRPFLANSNSNSFGSISSRNFSTTTMAQAPPIAKRHFLIFEEVAQWFTNVQRRNITKSCFTMGRAKKPPSDDANCSNQPPVQRAKGCIGQLRGKPCPPPDKCVPPPPPCCRRRPLNPACPLEKQPCPPPCPCPCPEVKEPPPPKIYFRKCPPLPKLPRLPKCPKFPPMPRAPALPKLPKRPKCPGPCPPPPPPPLPVCPKAPICKPCPPQKECPPPPPCEPCPCPPPCPPPCCPPPPPCPPCPPPIPCPKPLPCPPPVCTPCPPCPPCAACPAPPPCPPPPPCCPCPCPETPTPPPCPKPCPQPVSAKQPQQKCPTGVPSCSNFKKPGRTRKMSTCHSAENIQTLMTMQPRRIHTSWSFFDKSSSDSGDKKCTPLDAICKKKTECGKPCPKDKKDKKDKRKECKKEKKKVQPVEEDQTESIRCKTTCLPKGKCEFPIPKVPPKMEYEKTICPPPKFITPPPCPPTRVKLEPERGKKKKKICVPPPLPKPPCEPVVLCPCPPPPKIHPGPCPCVEHKEEMKMQQLPPCCKRDRYPCKLEPHVCPLKKIVCEKNLCEKKKKKKQEQEKNDPCL